MVKKIVYILFFLVLLGLQVNSNIKAQIAHITTSTDILYVEDLINDLNVEVTLQDENLLYANRVEMAVGKKLVVKNIKGDITIIGNNNSRELQIKVWQDRDIRLLGRDNSSEAGVRVWTQMDDLNIETISSSYNNRSKFSAAYKIELVVPKNVELFIDNQLGNVSIDEYTGTLAVAASQGNIKISNSAGSKDSRIKTFNGDISVSNYTGHLMALCSLGNLTLSNVDANLRVKTQKGDINGEKLSGTIIFKVTAGNIDIEVTDFVDLINLSSISGDIDVNVKTNQIFNLELAGAKIYFDEGNRFTGSIESQKVIGKIGSGGSPLILNATGNCNLTIRD